MDPLVGISIFEPSPQPRILPPCPTISAVARLVKRCWKIWQPSARISQSQPTIDTAYHCMFPRPLRLVLSRLPWLLEGCRILGEGYPCQPGAFQIHGARMARAKRTLTHALHSEAEPMVPLCPVVVWCILCLFVLCPCTAHKFSVQSNNAMPVKSHHCK